MNAITKNYNKNIEILKENLKRGLSSKQSNSVINRFELQLKTANAYNEEGQDFINEMRKTAIEHFTSLKINIIK